MRFENKNEKVTFNGKEIKSSSLRLLFGIFCVLFSALIVSVIVAVLLPVFGSSFKITPVQYFAFVVGILAITPIILAGSLVTGIVSGSVDIFTSSKTKEKKAAQKKKKK